jgi:acetyltransferase
MSPLHPLLSPARSYSASMRPYPAHLVQKVLLRDGSQVTIRPIRADDGELEQQFVRELSAESRYFRFMDAVRELSPRMVAHFTRIDYDRHMALIATADRDGREIEVAVARYVAPENSERCELAVVVADAWQRRGLGRRLLETLMAAARAAGIRVMYGDVLAGNRGMLRLMEGLGYSARFNPQDPRLMRVEKTL